MKKIKKIIDAINWLYVLEWLGRITVIAFLIAVIWAFCRNCGKSDNILRQELIPDSLPPPAIQETSGIGSQSPGSEWNDTDLVRAIWLTEGGSKAKYAYGIESVKYSSKAEARQICYRTIKNNRGRWERAGCPGDYLGYLSKIYCPYNSETWLKNVKYFLGRDN